MRNYLLRIFSLKPFTKNSFYEKKTLKKPLTFLDKGSRIYRAKLSESDEAGAKYCPFRFFIGKQSRNARKIFRKHVLFFGFFCLKKLQKCFLLHIFNICNVNVIFRIGVLIDL